VINIVSVSGGKDSTALLLLAIERGAEDIRPVFADTGHEHPLTYEYVDYLESAVGIPIRRVRANFKAEIAKKRETVMSKWVKDGVPQDRIDRALESLVTTGNPFLDLCMTKGRFPSTKVRFCTEELKVLPIYKQVIFPAMKDGPVVSWQGVRRDESRARANLPEYDVGDAGETIYRPLLDWTADDVFAMHRKHNIKPNPLYTQGMGRVGCMPCINVRKVELNEIAKRFPDEIERVRRWERLVSQASKRGSSTLIPAVNIDSSAKEPGAVIHYETHGIEAAAAWAATGRGGRQADWIKDLEPAVCASVYGLCE